MSFLIVKTSSFSTQWAPSSVSMFASERYRQIYGIDFSFFFFFFLMQCRQWQYCQACQCRQCLAKHGNAVHQNFTQN